MKNAFLVGFLIVLFLVMTAWCSLLRGEEVQHPATCALTASSHSKLMEEYLGDEDVQSIYKLATENGYPISMFLGKMFTEKEGETIAVLFIFVQDNEIDFRVDAFKTKADHTIVMFLIPKQSVEKDSLITSKK